MHGQIVRTDLLRLLDQSCNRSLTCILAPAGSGKTTLLHQWRERHRNRAIAMLRIAPGDNAPATFFRHFIDCLKRNAPLMDVPTVAPFITDAVFRVDTVTTVILQALDSIEDDLFVVLDGLQHIRSTPIQQVIYNLLRELPPNIHFILSSRVQPQFSLSWFRLENQLLVVDGDALRMSADHIAELNQKAGGAALPEHQVARLANLTEGWVAGVKLALLAYSRSGQAALDAFDGTQPEIVDYFGHVVLAGLCEETRLFFSKVLFSSSLVPSFVTAL